MMKKLSRRIFLTLSTSLGVSLFGAQFLFSDMDPIINNAVLNA